MVDDTFLRNMKTFGNNYLKKSLFQKPKEEMHYNKKMLCIGKTIEGNKFYLDLTESCRMLVLGLTRAGKTFTLRSIMDRLAVTGCDIIHLNDCKDEYKSSIYPLQGKFQHLLLPGETPTTQKVVALRPTFFKQINDALPKDNFWYSADFSKMTQNDFMTLMNVEQMTGPQKVTMEIIYENLKKKLDEGHPFSIELIEEIIEGIEELSTQQIVSMKFKFRPLKTANFYEEAYKRDIISLMKKGYIPAINMENFENFDKSAFKFGPVTLAIILRQVIQATRAKILKNVWIMFDEAPQFIGTDTNTSIKESISKSFMLDARYGINYVIVTQFFSLIPENMRANCKYIFLPYNIETGVLKEILLETGHARNVQTATNDALKMKAKMQRIPYSWLVLNKMSGNMNIITMSAPLSNHMETGD